MSLVGKGVAFLRGNKNTVGSFSYTLFSFSYAIVSFSLFLTLNRPSRRSHEDPNEKNAIDAGDVFPLCKFINARGMCEIA